MWQLFVGIYFSYLFLGPHWISNLLTGTKLRIVDTPVTLFRRSMYISYISLLYTAWFLYNPSKTTFIYAALLSFLSTMAFYTRYGPEDPLPMHLILNFIILLMGRDYTDVQFLMTLLLITMYPLFRNFLYIK